MGVRLTSQERGDPFTGDYHAALSALQVRLARLQHAQIVHGRRTIIVFEGWDGSGKRSALKRLAAAWDPCHFIVHSVRAGGFHHSEQHWLAPFWAALPRTGHSAIFYRSWYRRMVDSRVLGELNDKQWARALDEANEFEAQQADHGTLLIKLFFHVPADVQSERLHARADDPWRRPQLHADVFKALSVRDDYLPAWQEMFDQCDTRWAPWTLIDGSDKRAARIAALTAVAEAYEAAMPAEPPARDENIVMLPQEKYG